jgi:hypothetical protein
VIDWKNLLSAGIDRLDSEPHTDIASDMADRIMDRLDEPWAQAVARAALHEHCRAALNRAHKAAHSVQAVTRSGRVRPITSSVSRKVRASDSGDIVGRQRTLVWNYRLAEIEAYCDELVRVGAEHRERMQAWFRVRDAVRRHPDLTAAQAWVADGRSLDEIDLSA